MLDQQLVDPVLREGGFTHVLADKHPRGLAARAVQNCRRHQAVIQQHIGLLQQLQGTQCEQVRIPGAGADQVDLAQAAAIRARGEFVAARR